MAEVVKTMKKLMIAVTAAVLTMAPLTALAAGRNVVIVRRPAFGGYYGSAWGPYWGGGYGVPYPAYSNSGDVKIDTPVKDAEVFIDGAYAGTTKDNKTMHLRPGAYTIEVRHAGQPGFQERIYVVTGKTLHLHPGL